MVGNILNRRMLLLPFLLCFFAVTNAIAQDQLADMMGMWVVENLGQNMDIYYYYQATTGPSSLTLRYKTVKFESKRPNVSAGPHSSKLYKLNVAADRTLSGTVTVDTGAFAEFGCRFEQRTFPVEGRISSDWESITIVENHDVPRLGPCGWGEGEELVRVFKRYR